MHGSFILFIHVLLGNALGGCSNQLGPNRLDLNKDLGRRNDDPSVKKYFGGSNNGPGLFVKNLNEDLDRRNDGPFVRNVYDSVNKLENNVHKESNNVFKYGGNLKDVLEPNGIAHVDKEVEKVDDPHFVDLAPNPIQRQLCHKDTVALKHLRQTAKARYRRHMTRLPRKNTRTKRTTTTSRVPTTKRKRKKEKTTQEPFDIGKSFNVEEFEKFLNEDSHDRKVERNLRRQLGEIHGGIESHVQRNTNQTTVNMDVMYRDLNKRYEEELSAKFAKESSRITGITSGSKGSDEENKMDHNLTEKDEDEDDDLTPEYSESEEYDHSIENIEKGNENTKAKHHENPNKLDKATRNDTKVKHRRVKRFAKNRGKKKKGGGKGGGRGGGFDFGFGKQKNTNNKYKQGKKKTGGGGGGGGGELSYRGRQRGGYNNQQNNRNQHKNKKQHHNQHQKNKNQEQGDGIVREKLTITEIKDTDSILEQDVKILTNKKGYKPQHQPKKTANRKVLMLEVLNITNFARDGKLFRKLSTSGTTRKSNPTKPTVRTNRRVKRFARKKTRKVKPKAAKPKKGFAKKLPKAAKKAKKKKAKKKPSKVDGDDASSEDTSREKLTITELKSGEEANVTKREKTDKLSKKKKESDNKSEPDDDGGDTDKDGSQDDGEDSESQDSQDDQDSESAEVGEGKATGDKDEDESEDKRDKGQDKDKDKAKDKKDKDKNTPFYTDSQLSRDVSLLLKPRKDKKKEIEEVLGLKLDELKGKYQVDTDELYQEAVQAKKYFVELKKTKKSEKKPKTAEEKKKGQKGKKGKEGVTRRRGRGPPTKYTTKKRRETKKVFDYSAEIGDKDKFVKDEIKNMIRELNVSTRCNYCGSGKASIQHVLAGCKMALYFGFYSRRHDRVLHIIRNAFEEALQRYNGTSGILPLYGRKEALSAEDPDRVDAQFLARLRYILTHKPQPGNGTKKRGRKAKAPPAANASLGEDAGHHGRTHDGRKSMPPGPQGMEINKGGRKSVPEEVDGLKSVDGEGKSDGELQGRSLELDEDDELEGRNLVEEGLRPTTPMNVEDLTRDHPKEEEKVNKEGDKLEEQEESPQELIRELTSYEFKINLKKHPNVFIGSDFDRDNPLHPFISTNNIQSILGLTNDWQLYSFPIGGLQRNTSQLKPDLLLYSDRLKYMLIAELTIPWDFNMDRQSANKEKKYRSLIRAMTEKQYSVHFFTIQVGLTGRVDRELERLFKNIGLEKPTRKRYLADITNSTLESSLSIWNRRSERKWKFWIFWKKHNQEKYKRKHSRSKKKGAGKN
ncbi:hypothetical protein M8J75_001687 [Diaphorina citri]|nr:hypothetical protein M8J75_001687 [Diaphorina citri]